MERLLLLWDELDELVGFGRLFAASLAHSVAHHMRRRAQRLPRGAAADQA